MKTKTSLHSPVRIVMIIGVVILAIANLMPIAWGALTSIKPADTVMQFPPVLFGFSPTGTSYHEVLTSSTFSSLRTSLFYSLGSMAVGLVISILCAYALDRLRFPGRRILLYVIVASIPLSMGAATLIIPNYLYFSFLNMTDQWYTLPIVYIGHSIPLATWVLKGSMEFVPVELDEAAKIDGLSRIGILRKIIVPLCRPGMVAASLFLFIGAWNEFVAGSVMVSETSLRPIQVAIYQYISVLGRLWGPLTAASILALGPIIIFVVVLGKHLVGGLTGGAVKS